MTKGEYRVGINFNPKDTGFHPNDPDWTRGRAMAVAEADSIARKDMWRTRKVALAAMEARNG